MNGPRALSAARCCGATWLAALLLAGCLAAPAPAVLRLADGTTIAGPTTWSGTVHITGVVTVSKGGHLTILPGTRVLFEKLDRDGDGIGDSELLIEGGLVAEGTQAAPIVFTSAAAQPQKADWKYLYLDFAREGRVAHIVSEYAYSGIQVHFCKAQVRDSVFRYNSDGVRFSTVNIEVRGNRIYGNTNGLRYEERNSRALVRGNDITGNDIGIFVVTRSDDKAQIEQNNIAGNRLYNVKLGIDQAGDVTLPRNWWGTAEPEAIAASFFDRAYDHSLGRVRAPEPLTKPLTLATGETP